MKDLSFTREIVDKKLKLSYSQEAVLLLNASKDFDIDEFEEKFVQDIPVGSRTILEYVMEKEREKHNG